MSSPKPNVHRHIQEQLEVWFETISGESLDRGKCLETQSPTSPLIGIGRIDESVAEDDLTACLRRKDHFTHMLSACRCHQQHLGLRENSIIVQTEKNRTNRLTDSRSPWLSRHKHRISGRTQRIS